MNDRDVEAQPGDNDQLELETEPTEQPVRDPPIRIAQQGEPRFEPGPTDAERLAGLPNGERRAPVSA